MNLTMMQKLMALIGMGGSRAMPAKRNGGKRGKRQRQSTRTAKEHNAPGRKRFGHRRSYLPGA